MYMTAILIGALVIGVLLGLVPLILGFIKGCKGLAIGGFFACVVAAFILGLILGIPMCILFVWLILRKAKQNNSKECPFCAEMIPANAKVCSHCNNVLE